MVCSAFKVFAIVTFVHLCIFFKNADTKIDGNYNHSNRFLTLLCLVETNPDLRKEFMECTKHLPESSKKMILEVLPAQYCSKSFGLLRRKREAKITEGELMGTNQKQYTYSGTLDAEWLRTLKEAGQDPSITTGDFDIDVETEKREATTEKRKKREITKETGQQNSALEYDKLMQERRKQELVKSFRKGKRPDKEHRLFYGCIQKTMEKFENLN